MIVNETLKEILSFREMGFEIEKTKDDSPTLRIINGEERGGESMHHSGGALSETCLIYGQAFDWGFKNNSEPTIVSLGLGLGYVEILACAYGVLHNSSLFQIFSFERVSGLRESFYDFFAQDKEFATYDWILNLVADKVNVSAKSLKTEVKKALAEKRLQLLGDFVSDESKFKHFDIFCYDAYSKKTSPELWDENHMAQVFAKGTQKSCISSYASNGSLKRALIMSGYTIEKLDGFQGKRNRTWAYKS